MRETINKSRRMLSEAGGQQILHQQNDTGIESPGEKCIHELFAEQAERTPDVVAVEYESQQLTYADLNRKANQLAHYLRTLGVNPESRVAICVERGLEMIIGLLGILKAGGAYVPLDPAYPQERLHYMLEDSRPVALLTQAQLRERMEALPASLPTLDLTDTFAWSNQPENNPEAANMGLTAKHLAYVIYTSGSTGQPKGVLVEHANVVRLFAATDAWFHFNQNDVWTLFHSYAFDFSVWEIWGALLHGGRLIVVGQDTARSSEDFYRLVCQKRVTVLNQTPSAFRQLIAAQGRSEEEHGLRWVIFGGEALDMAMLRPWWERNPNGQAQLINMYGITETTVHVTYRALKRSDSESAGSPIGCSIPDLRIYILNEKEELVPVGVAGELYIGGPGVARGYLQRPELTAERFVPDPYVDEAGARMYKTGDLGRWKADGEIEFVGRNDDQVKIRGFRIELGEIMARLQEHPSVEEAVVIAREDALGEKQLVGYVVLRRKEGLADGAETGQEGKQLEEWQGIYEDLYREMEGREEERFKGWISSYDGRAIPLDEMEEWRRAAVERILKLQPKRVLEIGAGSGLILTGVGPECEEYWATDFSGAAVAELKRQVERDERLRGRVEVRQQAAHDGNGLPTDYFDTVILNSVVQYFPSTAYLVKVVEEGLRRLRPGGRIYIGDVRHKGLLECFATGVELGKGKEGTGSEEVRWRARQSVLSEKELVLEPDFFVKLGNDAREIGGVDIRLKRGWAQNELSRYRYEVVLQKVGGIGGEEEIRVEGEECVEWRKIGGLEGAAWEIDRRRPRRLRISGVPNGRVEMELRGVEWLRRKGKVEEVRRALAEQRKEGMEPEELQRWGEEKGYEVLVTWSGEEVGKIDVVLVEGERREKGKAVVDGVYAGEKRRRVSLWELSNHPETRDEVGRVMKELREYVRERLPEYMVPAAIVEMESLPLSSSGKLDRKALPAPEADAYGIQSYQAPEGDIETVLADIWAELLQIRRVGRLDNFFALGGHSLLAARAVTRIRQGLSMVVTVDDLFRNPVLADLARRLKDVARAELPPIVRSKQRDRFPLSLAQQRLWFLSQMDEVSRAYHVPVGLHLKGELDSKVLRRALDRMVARHETLRTTFVLIDGEPMQQVAAVADSRFHLLESDLRRHGDAKAEVNRLLIEEVNASFNLETGPLIRGLLIRESEDEHTLLITMHHIVSDGWSLGVFRNEVSKLYSAFRRGQEDPLPELAVQYADFAIWERQWLEEEVLGQQCEYWKRTLQGVPELLELPTDHPRPAQQDYRGGIEKLVLEQKLTSGLKELSRRQGTTLYMTLLAGWAALLSRLSGQAEIVIGTPVANRERADIEGLIGFFVNTLALRIDFSGQVTVKELLKQVKEVALGAQQNQNLPFERVVDIVGPERNLAHNPLFQVTFSWQNLPEGTIMLPEVEVKPLESIPYQAAKFDLALVLQEANGMIVGELEYANSLFDSATITRYLGYFRSLLDGMIADESGVVSRLAMLSQKEREQILHQWNDTGIAYQSEKCIHELFTEQAERTPNVIAVEYESQQLTYVDLNRKANQLAHYLQALGVKPESRVAICVERSLEMIIGLLGILKAGGAYVPLDPEYPGERLSYMLESAQVKVLLMQERLLGQMPEFAGAVVVLDGVEERQRLGEQRAENPEVKLEGENLAYIIYTSGSTGRPKGVVITHDALANHMAWIQKEFSLSAGERVLQKTAFGFDASVWEFYAPLLSGGCLIMARPGGQRDPEYMVSCIREQRISVLQLVPTQLQMLLQHGGLRECGGLQRVYCGGEALSTEAVRELYAQLPTARLYNLYGPTEATIDSTFAVCDHELRSITAPIGKAIANMRVYVVDEEMVPVPVGVPGELCLRGVGLARGYWGRGDLTAERFVPDGLSGRRGERLYRTGDLVRWLKDGNLEFLGRLDHQVKIRGFRIELGEITARLLENPAVKEAVVVAREDVPGEKRLVVYYSLTALHASSDQEPLLPDLRSFLCKRLPEHMVPAVYVLMQSLPLTPNGKLDHKALPAPQGDAYGVRSYVPPQGDLESALAAIWAEVLRLKQVGRYDNFFRLGGQSLLALRVLFRVNDCFQTRLSVRALLEHPVLMEFAQKLDSASGRPREQLEKIAEIWLRVRRMTSEELKAALAVH